MESQVSNQQTVQLNTTTSVLAQTFAALVFGMVIIYGVGFAPMNMAHNAAHDVRHSVAFPCH